MDVKNFTNNTTMEDFIRWHANRAFVYFGRLAPSKGVHIILRCWLKLIEKYPNECPPLWIIGGSISEIASIREYSELQSKLDIYEKNSRLIWWGYLDQPGLSTILLRALVVITHSKYEPGGRVILEAMRQGVPVIATPHGFAPDLISDWVSGFLVPYEDEDLLMKRMNIFIHLSILNQSLGTQAKKVAIEAISKWDFVNTHFLIYDSISNKLPLPKARTEPFLKNYNTILKNRTVLQFDEITNEDTLSENVLAWAKGILGEDAKIKTLDVNGKSKAWLATSKKRKIWIKNIHSHFRMTSFWLQHGNKEILHSAKEKFLSEIFNGSGLVDTIASNSDRNFIATPLCSHIPKYEALEDQIARMKETLRLLATISAPISAIDQFRNIVNDCANDIEKFDFNHADKLIDSATLNKFSPTPISYRASLRLTFTLFMQAALLDKLFLPDGMKDDFVSLSGQFRKVISLEDEMPIVLLHNSSKPTHFLIKNDGSTVLIDKEKLCFGFKGKDHGELIATLARQDENLDIKYVVKLLGHENKSFQKIILAWTGLHLIAEAGFQLACEQYQKSVCTYNAWKKWFHIFKKINL